MDSDDDAKDGVRKPHHETYKNPGREFHGDPILDAYVPGVKNLDPDDPTKLKKTFHRKAGTKREDPLSDDECDELFSLGIVESLVDPLAEEEAKILQKKMRGAPMGKAMFD